MAEEGEGNLSSSLYRLESITKEKLSRFISMVKELEIAYIAPNR